MTKIEWLEETSNNIADCNNCERLRAVTPYPMSHICYGSLSKVKLFFVGRNPGLENDHNKISREEFVEKYHDLWWDCNLGKYLRKNFGELLIKENMFFSNVNKCSSPENSKLTEEEKRNCLPFLETQLEIIKPSTIVTFGVEAKETIKSLNLQNMDIINLMHPAYFAYNKDFSLVRKQYKAILKIRNKYEENTSTWYTGNK